jgi:3-dehydroquinate synthase
MKTIKVNLRNNPYNIYLGKGAVSKVPGYVKKEKLGNFGIVITTSKIHSCHKNLINRSLRGKKHKIIYVPGSEKAKSKQCLFSVIRQILKADTLNRKLYLICLGGGTVGDLGGFIASIYKRGLPYVQVPTTLLAQIDSSIGGKTAIDLPEAKNILGTFYQPQAVFIDPVFLKTLPKKEFKQGLAEAIKYGLIKDAGFFKFLEKNQPKVIQLHPPTILKLISVCSRIKAKIVAADEQETKGLRTILNFGHTFAHALESSLKYKIIPHGQAVAFGMIYAALLSQDLKKCSKNTSQKIVKIIKLYNLFYPLKVDPLTLYRSLVYDKKFISGKIRMVLLRRIGKVEVAEGISPQKIKEILRVFSRL